LEQLGRDPGSSLITKGKTTERIKEGEIPCRRVKNRSPPTSGKKEPWTEDTKRVVRLSEFEHQEKNKKKGFVDILELARDTSVCVKTKIQGPI